MGQTTEHTNIAWHPAFIGAASFDFRKERDQFQLISEHNLSKEPLRIDLLVLKMDAGFQSTNDIARIFRKHNIIEYKSPDDGLTIDDLYKTLSYAYLYKGTADKINEIPASELSVSLFRERFPKKMVSLLREEGAKVIKTASGIYEVTDLKPLPLQIIVTKELDQAAHTGLRLLSRNATDEDIVTFLEQLKTTDHPGDLANGDAILQASIAANLLTYDNLRRRDNKVCEALKYLMQDQLDLANENGIKEGIKEGELKTQQKIALKM